MAREISYKKRKRVFERDNFTCKYCGKKAEKILEHRGISYKPLITLYISDDWRPFEIDHKKPVSLGGTNDTRNLVTSCAKCNNKKSSKIYKNFLLELNISNG